MTTSSTDVQAKASATHAIKTPRSGWYVGGGLGLGGHLETWNLSTSVKGSAFQPMPSVAVDLGYQFAPYFAMGLYAFSDAYHWTENEISGYVVGVPILLYLKGILPLNNRWNLYAKVGVGGSTVGDIFVSAGLGGSYQMTKSLAFTMEFDMNYGELENMFSGLFGDRYEIYTPTLMCGVAYFF